MSIAESILPEFDHEAATTRALLLRVPEAKADWKPHEKSRSLGALAQHIANLSFYLAPMTLRQTEFDANPPDGTANPAPRFESTTRLLTVHDEGVKNVRSLLLVISDAEFMVPWTFKSGGKKLFSMPRAAAFRSLVLNHAVHHRGQLSVYLRLLDVPLPGIYGPTADTE
jgi:uncharacterized damage-inducible protein DinB